ncbi:MAG: thiazole synthase [Epsilonproteobacteria bacterium]|nr:MAG: thiazole synthase [Campylobacterota bacterium]RLA66458.1 MAG: thiazole synthase [Campylobacterota bacterium]
MWELFEKSLKSRLLLGTSRYPSPEVLKKSILSSNAGIITVSLRRSSGGEGNPFWEMLNSLGVQVLPNTAGCHSVNEAVTTAQMAREIFGTNWLKLEVIGDDYTLIPNPSALVEAAEILCRDGFEVFPYMTEDLTLAEKLLEAGCKILMPWASPIGSGQGIVNPLALKTLREKFPEVPMVVDAGIGSPSHAAHAMELGFDGVLLNTAVATSLDPIKMARAFALAIEGGREGYLSGIMEQRDFAHASTPVVGTPFWHNERRDDSSQ